MQKITVFKRCSKQQEKKSTATFYYSTCRWHDAKKDSNGYSHKTEQQLETL